MRLFKSNKSQASLNNLPEGRSSEQSPIESPLQSPSFPPPPQSYKPPPEGHSDQPSNLPSTHSATGDIAAQSPRPRPSRSTSLRNSPFVYNGRPTVNVVGPSTPENEEPAGYESPHPSQQGRAGVSPTDRDSRKSKRSIFGINSTPRAETTTQQQSRQRPLARSLSVRGQVSESYQSSLEKQHNTAPDYPDLSATRLTYSNTSQDRLKESSTLDQATAQLVDSETGVAERYYQTTDLNDSPVSQVTSNAQLADEPPPYSSPHPNSQYKAFQPVPQQNPPNTYLPYQPQSNSDRPSLNPVDSYYQRPPSQQSHNPPSPVASIQSQFDPRQSSLSNRQLVSPQPQRPPSQGTMGRGEGQGANMRQQVNQPQYQQQLDSAHGQQYQQTPTPGQSSNRLVREASNNDQGRASPQPPRVKDELRDDLSALGYSNHDVQAMLRDLQSQKLDLAGLMLKHHELRKEPYVEFQLNRHEELQAKYSKVKKYYFEKDAQVTTLQNTVAHQRLSMSHTSLDDTEYYVRFQRLDGAIGELAFMFRDQWRSTPPWLQYVVNREAAGLGKKEMTAVGRACITRWLMDEIFDRFYHPSLERNLSAQLKIMEKNIRRTALMRDQSNEASRDDLITKLVNWRLTTNEGLADIMTSAAGEEYRLQLLELLIEKLTASLAMNLKPNESDPTEPPKGLHHHVTSIIEISLSIAANIPKESRDVYIEYFMPGALISETYMKFETSVLPPLTNPAPGGEDTILTGSGVGESSLVTAENSSSKSGSASAAGDTASVLAGENGSIADTGDPSEQMDQTSSSLSTTKAEKKKSTFLGIGTNRKPTPSEANGTPGGGAGRASSSSSVQKEKEAKEKAEQEKFERERRIRFSSFMAVEVRGRGAAKGEKEVRGGDAPGEKGEKEGGRGNTNVLYKAPVYAFV
ncbi:MAG: hypothetical protein Q9160_006168 [Pyrenula sp. 1 TL-2023]